MEERELLHLDVAPLGELRRRGRLADEPLIGQVLARRRDPFDAQVPREMILDFGDRARLADLAQVVEHRRKELRRSLGEVAIDGIERRAAPTLRSSSADSEGRHR